MREKIFLRAEMYEIAKNVSDAKCVRLGMYETTSDNTFRTTVNMCLLALIVVAISNRLN